MTVKELREALAYYDDDDLVVLSSDTAVSYSPLYRDTRSRYLPATSKRGEQVETGGIAACILWPSN
jgi:hypothetical protein